MAERAQAELGAVLEQVHANGRSSDPAGPWLVREPEFSGLRAQWPYRPSGQPAATAKDARSRETLEAVESAHGDAPVGRDLDPGIPEISSASALSWRPNDDDAA